MVMSSPGLCSFSREFEVADNSVGTLPAALPSAVAGAATVDLSRLMNINEPPWSTTESKTIKQQIGNKS
jgi:hypothetical protein